MGGNIAKGVTTNMLFRSTGLGKTELTADVVNISRQGDYIILHVDTLEPVRWRIRAAFCCKDLGTVIKLMLKGSIMGLILWPRNWRKNSHPGEF